MEQRSLKQITQSPLQSPADENGQLEPKLEGNLGFTHWKEQDLHCGVESWVQGGVGDWGSAHRGIPVLSFMVE